MENSGEKPAGDGQGLLSIILAAKGEGDGSPPAPSPDSDEPPQWMVDSFKEMDASPDPETRARIFSRIMRMHERKKGGD